MDMYSVLIWVEVAVLVIMVIFILFNLLRYNINFVQKSLAADGKKLTKIRKARIDQKQNVLKLRGFKPNIADIPPEEAIEVHDGFIIKRSVTAYLTATGNFIYGIDESKIEKIPDNILDLSDPEERAKKITEWEKKNLKTAYKPVTSNQRAFYINQQRKADAEDIGWTKHLGTIALSMAIIIVVVFAYLGFSESMDFLAEQEKAQQKYLELHRDIVGRYEGLYKDVQQFKQTPKEAPD